jgi:hypothetical protein
MIILLYLSNLITSVCIAKKFRLMRHLILFGSLASGLLSCQVRNNHHVEDLTRFWDETRVLVNPHKGWYHHYYDNGLESYLAQSAAELDTFPGMHHLYLRFPWGYIEPQQGVYDWSLIDDIVMQYVPKGYKISLRITCKETGTQVPEVVDGVHFATPYWVKMAGAKGTVTEAWGVKSWSPDWNDPVYLEMLDRFHAALAARYDGEPWLIYIDIGSIGDWGEGHTHFSTQVPPTVDEVKKHIDLHVRHYKHTLVVSTDDLLSYGKEKEQRDELLSYAIRSGCSLRDDSPLVDWYIQHYLDTWSVQYPYYFDSVYLNRPVILECQHYHIFKNDGNWLGLNGEDTIPGLGVSGADILRNAIRKMKATYIGYHGYARDWHRENPDLTRELLNLCGYWYFPVKVEHASVFQKGKVHDITISWINRGVAPAYVPFVISFELEGIDNDGVYAFNLDSGNLQWLPGDTVSATYSVQIPSHAIAGDHVMKIKLYDPLDNTPVEIGLEAGLIDDKGYYEISRVKVR